MKKIIGLLVVLGIVIATSGLASATFLVDRGLPTTNLNNAAGSNRSNVEWAFGADSAGNVLAGDSFQIGGTGDYLVDTIRLWSSSDTGGFSLYFGEAGGTISQLAATPTVTATSYVDGTGDQGWGPAGNYYQLFQLDFKLDMVLNGLTTYQFFLNGAPYAWLHASNAALSGSTQQGADGQMLYALAATGSNVATNIGSWSSLGDGWDKNSDINIQVIGAPVPEPGTMMLLGIGMAGLAFYGKRRKNN